MRLISILLIIPFLYGCEEARTDRGRFVSYEEVRQAFQERDQALTALMARIIEIEKKTGISQNDKKDISK